MTEICLFAGTSEGRILAEFLGKQSCGLTVCVATEYGGDLLACPEQVRVIRQRLSKEEILHLFEEYKYDLVIDATHPYAAEVTENISEACNKTGTEYLRVLREKSGDDVDAMNVPDVESAVDFLETVTGNILLTTGSKDIGKFSRLADFSGRVFARVLPLVSSLEACQKAGLRASQIIAMQGPFSVETNIAQLHETGARWLVTKDSGTAGGFEAKAEAARRANAGLVVIGRPAQRDGLSEPETFEFLKGRFGFVRKPYVTVVGIGPGAKEMMTESAVRAIESADCLIGAHRMLESVSWIERTTFAAVDPDDIVEFIHGHPQFQHFAVLMSGDSGFFSGTQRLLPKLENCEVQVIPGISSLSVVCSKMRISYEEIPSFSLHGRDRDIIPELRRNRALFLLTGGENTPANVCRKIAEAGLTDLRVTVGERLSYPDEKITSGNPSELASLSFAPLSVMLIQNDRPDAPVTHGLPDELFQRVKGDEKTIPMTKQEIRSVCLSKLSLTEDAVCWDIGCGTGSVAVEMALLARKGMVYGIEKDPEAVSLIRKNAARFHVSNLAAVEGEAPGAVIGLPTPTHVFIGGCSGNIRRIIQILSERDAEIRVVITAVSLETMSEVNAILNEHHFPETETVMIQTARAKKAGSHSLMSGGNPVYIFSLKIPGGTK